MSSTGVGAFGGNNFVGQVLSKIFERGRVPAFSNGRVPAYPNGYIPSDHFLAYIGTKEAIIRKEATQANRDILAWMNTNNGRRYDANSNVVVNITGNVLSKDFIRSQVIPIIQNELRYKGQKTFGVK
jgi:hypothetical protein